MNMQGVLIKRKLLGSWYYYILGIIFGDYYFDDYCIVYSCTSMLIYCNSIQLFRFILLYFVCFTRPHGLQYMIYCIFLTFHHAFICDLSTNTFNMQQKLKFDYVL